MLEYTRVCFMSGSECLQTSGFLGLLGLLGLVGLALLDFTGLLDVDFTGLVDFDFTGLLDFDFTGLPDFPTPLNPTFLVLTTFFFFGLCSPDPFVLLDGLLDCFFSFDLMFIKRSHKSDFLRFVTLAFASTLLIISLIATTLSAWHCALVIGVSAFMMDIHNNTSLDNNLDCG